MLLHISLMYTSKIVVLSNIYLYIASKMSLVSFIQCYYFKSIITPQLSNYRLTTRYVSYNCEERKGNRVIPAGRASRGRFLGWMFPDGPAGYGRVSGGHGPR